MGFDPPNRVKPWLKLNGYHQIWMDGGIPPDEEQRSFLIAGSRTAGGRRSSRDRKVLQEFASERVKALPTLDRLWVIYIRLRG